MALIPQSNLRHPWLRYQVAGYTKDIVHNYEWRLEIIWDRSVNRVHILDFKGLTHEMRQDLAVRLRMVYAGGDEMQPFVRLHTEEEMAHAGFRAYWSESERDPMRRLCHRMIACTIYGRGQGPKKVIGVDLFYLRTMDWGTANVPYLLDIICSGMLRGGRAEPGYLGDTSLDVLLSTLAQHLWEVWRHLGLGSPGAKRQQGAAVDAPEADEDAPDAAEGAQANPAPAQALPPPPPKTLFTAWEANGISHLLDVARASYTRYSKTRIPYQRRRVRRRTGEASTLGAPDADDQSDP
ncbi:hypothetical protein Tco_1497357 [Tanacetum coccineum]